MNCNECKENLNAYLDGELAAAQAGEMANHIAACAVCARELEALRKLCVGVAALPRATVPDSFLTGVRAKIAADQASPFSTRAREWLRELFLPEWNWPKVPAFATALVLLTAVSIFYVGRDSARPPMTMAKAERGMAMPATPVPSSVAVARDDAGEKKLTEDLKAPPAPVIEAGKRAEVFAKADELAAADKDQTAPTPVPVTIDEPAPVAPAKPAVAAKNSLEKSDPDRAEVSVARTKVGTELKASPVVAQLDWTQAREQTTQIFTCATDNVMSTRKQTLEVLDRCGGSLVAYQPGVQADQAHVLWAQVPTAKVQSVADELGKIGAVTVLPSQQTPRYLAFDTKERPPEEAKVVARKSALKSQAKPAQTTAPAPAPQTKPADSKRQLVNSGQTQSNAVSPTTTAATRPSDKVPGKNEAELTQQPAPTSVAAGYTIVEIQLQQTVNLKARKVPPASPQQQPPSPAKQKKG